MLQRSGTFQLCGKSICHAQLKANNENRTLIKLLPCALVIGDSVIMINRIQEVYQVAKRQMCVRNNIRSSIEMHIRSYYDVSIQHHSAATHELSVPSFQIHVNTCISSAIKTLSITSLCHSLGIDCNMYRRSVAVLAKRTVVRDPRKNATLHKHKLAPIPRADQEAVTTTTRPPQTPLPIAPPQLPQSVGGTLGFYLIAGVGVTIGFALVGAVLG